MTRILPDGSHIDRLRGEAKALLRRFRAGDAAAQALVARHAKFRELTTDALRRANVSLQDVQHALAMDYGYLDWAGLARAARLPLSARRLESLSRAGVASNPDDGQLRWVMEAANANATLIARDHPFARALAAGDTSTALSQLGADPSLAHARVPGSFQFDDWDSDEGQTQSALFHAAGRGYDRVVLALLDRGAEPNAVSMFHRPSFPLERAVHVGSYESVRFLLEAGADPTLSSGLLYTALTHQGSDKADLLLRSGASHNIQSAAILGDVAAINAMVERDPNCLASRETNYELLAIEEAAKKGHFPTVRHLSALGSPVTLFVRAALGEVRELAAGLDADPAALNRDYGTDGDRLIHVAALNGESEVVNLLIDRGADPAGTIDRMLGQHRVDYSIVDLLIERGVEPSKYIHVSLLAGNTDLAIRLIERGAKLDQGALIALTTWAWWNYLSADKFVRGIQFLTTRGVDPNTPNDDGATACDIVRRPGSRSASGPGYEAVLDALRPRLD